MNLVIALFQFFRACLVARANLAAENLALRQQLAVLQRSVPRPRLRRRDRLFWVWLSRWCADWRSWLTIVKPETVVRWHRAGFRLFWTWKSRHGKQGRPAIAAEARRLIRSMSRDNPTWGTPRIQAESHLLGLEVARSTIDKHRVCHRKPPSQTWKTFLKNHVGCLAAMDFCVVPTITFGLLYLFIVLRHDRRRVVHFAVTAHPTQQWVAQQLREAFPFDEAPRYLLRDRDAIYGLEVRRCLDSLGIKEVLIAPRSPWQSPYVERFIGTLRRECLDHVIVFQEAQLRGLIRSFLDYYHNARTHRSLGQNAPNPRAVEPPSIGKVIAIPQVGGLHHRYTRAA